MNEGDSRRNRARGRGDHAVNDEAARPRRGRIKARRHWRGTTWEWVKAILWALAVALVIRQFFFQAFRIPTGSMKETLQIHDFLFANKFIYGAKTPDRLGIPFLNLTLVDNIPHLKLPAIRQPRQGDIIVFVYPEDRRTDYIKRCVAVAGDTIRIRDGILSVNGRIYESNFAERDGDHSCVPSWQECDECPQPRSLRSWSGFQRTRGTYRHFGPYVVPPEHLFMMGDNRYSSQDSREWGPLPLELVKGKAEFIYWSYENLFFLPRWDRLLLLIDLSPSRAWVQSVVRIGFGLLIVGSIIYYRRPRRRED